MNILVVGKAKTGTTVISKTIQNSLLGESQYFLEPKEPDFFHSLHNKNVDAHFIVKIIFEHWLRNKDFVQELFSQSGLGGFYDKKIAIIRDPRDELISRLMYIVKPYIDKHGVDREKIDSWIRVLKCKEVRPSDMSFVTLTNEFDKIFDTTFLKNNIPISILKEYVQFIEALEEEVFILKYEDFIVGDTSKLSQYLGLTLSDNRDVGALNYTKRSASFGAWKSVFTPRDVVYFSPILKKNLDLYHYNNWDLEPVQQLEAQDFSGYVNRLVGEV